MNVVSSGRERAGPPDGDMPGAEPAQPAPEITSILASLLPPTGDRRNLYMRYLIERGMVERYGSDWAWECPERPQRLAMEVEVIESAGFSSYFLILADIMDWVRRQRIPYGPGRGSVGGSYVAFAMGIHEMDSLEWGLLFDRFLNRKRVSYPDVDIDVSQRDRERVLAYIRKRFEDEHTAVLGVAAFARAGARRTIDMVATAMAQHDPDAMGIAIELKKMLPEGNNVTGGTKQEQELHFWLEASPNGRQQRAFKDMSVKCGWFDTLMALDGVQTHLTQHAAGVVIISREDLRRLPQTSYDGQRMMTGYDMYALDTLKYLKIDILGLRTLDIISDAHRFIGGDGTTPALLKRWREQRDDIATYQLLCDADTLGVFQVETSGYRKTLKDFQPRTFDHIVQLNALYRPGALDFKRPDGKNMVEVFIDRMHDREPITYPTELKSVMTQILGPTQGIVLYQEQSMQLARELAGFDDAEADSLRKAIGKKMLKLMASMKEQFVNGMLERGYTQVGADLVWDNIEKAARYSWNKSHAVFYAWITWCCAYLKANARHAFYAALVNSLSEDKDRQADAVAEARQHVEVRPPDINIAQDGYTVDGKAVVFGLNGIKGMGEANRTEILLERLIGGSFASFQEFHQRLPSVPINMKLSLIRCGAFDSVESRAWLLATGPYLDQYGQPLASGKRGTIAEIIKHNAGLKNPRPLPGPAEVEFPSERELADGEMETIGFYVSNDPMADVNKALGRLERHKHWGGQVESLQIKTDRRGAEYARFTILTPSLNKQRCMVFGSDWPQCKQMVTKGARVILRGYMDGSQVIAEGVFPAGDYRHFKTIIMTRDGERVVDPRFDGKLETVELAERSGYTVQLI